MFIYWLHSINWELIKINADKDLIDLWKSRIGLFAKVRYLVSKDIFKNKEKEVYFRFGVVKEVLDMGILVLHDLDEQNQWDININDITESSVEQLKQRRGGQD